MGLRSPRTAQHPTNAPSPRLPSDARKRHQLACLDGRVEAVCPLGLHSCIGEGNGNPLQCSCLENPRDGGAWWAAVYEVAQSQTQLKRLSSSRSSSFCAAPADTYADAKGKGGRPSREGGRRRPGARHGAGDGAATLDPGSLRLRLPCGAACASWLWILPKSHISGPPPPGKPHKSPPLGQMCACVCARVSTSVEDPAVMYVRECFAYVLL